MAAAGYDLNIRLWDLATGKELQCLARVDTVECLAFSPDGKVLASAGSGKVRLWDVSSGKERKSWPTDQGDVYSLQFAQGGKLLFTGEAKGIVRWWDWARGKVVRQIRGRVLGCCLKGARAAILRGEQVELWEVAKPACVRRFPSRDRWALPPGTSWIPGALSKDGSLLVAADWNTVRVVDRRTGADVRSSLGHTGEILFVEFSADDSQLITAGDWAAPRNLVQRI